MLWGCGVNAVGLVVGLYFVLMMGLQEEFLWMVVGYELGSIEEI